MTPTTLVGHGRATAEAVSRWLPTAAARVWQVGFVVTKWLRAGYLRVLQYPLPKPFIPQTSPSSQLPGAGTLGQEWPQCRVDPVWTPPTNV
jgi:hypothetical protein